MKTCWAKWKDVFYRLISLAASYLTLIGVLITVFDKDEWSGYLTFFVLVSFLATVILVFLEVKSVSHIHKFDPADKEGIQDYMHDWIKSGGRVAIWTRDMSWANNEHAKSLLMKKATDGELIICLPSSTDLTRELQRAGAEICTYSTTNFDPEARFTIREFSRSGSRVAIGRNIDGLHVIEEYTSGKDPVYSLTLELVGLARSKNR